MQTQNIMTSALVSAGFPAMPLNKRVWLWLHDHPGKTCGEIAAAINSDDRAASVALRDLYLRKMVIRKTVVRRVGKYGEKRNIFEYETCIREFELLPLPAKTKANGATLPSIAEAVANGQIKVGQAVAAPRASVAQSAPEPASGLPAMTSKAAIDVRRLSVSEALRLYGELKAIFGDRT